MGSNFDCCLKDCSYNSLLCQGNKCPGQVNNILNPECLENIGSFCLGNNISDKQWVEAWTIPTDLNPAKLPPCVYYLSRFLLRDTPPGVIDISSTVPPSDLIRSSFSVAQLRTFISTLLENYKKRGYVLGSPANSPAFSPLEYSLYSICKNVPGICSNYLGDFCSSFTGQDLQRNPSLAKWCGCYLPDKEYSTYVNSYQVNKECTPYCLREESVPLSTAAGNAPLLCRQSVCILDNIAINLQNSSVNGGASFTQICGDCGKNGFCSCITNDINLTIVNSRVRGSINFNQSCNAAISKCTTKLGNVEIEVPCENGEDISKKIEKELNQALIRRNTYILVIILAAIFFVGIVWLILSYL